MTRLRFGWTAQAPDQSVGYSSIPATSRDILVHDTVRHHSRGGPAPSWRTNICTVLLYTSQGARVDVRRLSRNDFGQETTRLALGQRLSLGEATVVGGIRRGFDGLSAQTLGNQYYFRGPPEGIVPKVRNARDDLCRVASTKDHDLLIERELDAPRKHQSELIGVGRRRMFTAHPAGLERHNQGLERTGPSRERSDSGARPRAPERRPRLGANDGTLVTRQSSE
jgi:hypothetical protein